MTKEIRCKCKICRAKHRESFMIQIVETKYIASIIGYYVCHDCACEYRKIFYGYQNRESRKKKPLDIPKEINDRYDQAFRTWHRYFEDQMNKKNLEEENGISEDT